MAEAKSEVREDAGVHTIAETRPRVVPLEADFDRAIRPFQASAGKKCYVIFDKGPPAVLTEVSCSDIIIVDQKMKLT